MKLLSILCSLALLSLASAAKAAYLTNDVLLQNTNYDSFAGAVRGQSFTTPDDLGGADLLLGFATMDGANNIGNSGAHLYLFTEAYTGSVAGLTTADALAVATYNTTTKYYDFSSANITLQADTTYYAYFDTSLLQNHTTSGVTDFYSGGEEYLLSGGNFAPSANNDMAFQIISTTPAPEPSAFALAGLGGLTTFFFARRRK